LIGATTTLDARVRLTQLCRKFGKEAIHYLTLRGPLPGRELQDGNRVSAISLQLLEYKVLNGALAIAPWANQCVDETVTPSR
jgi:hypothetical protein